MQKLPKKYRKESIIMLLCFIIASATLVNIASAQAITVYVDPPEQTVRVCSDFYVFVKIMDVVTPSIHDYDFFLYYDPSKMTPLNAFDGGFLHSPVSFHWEVLQGPPASVHCWANTGDGGATGSGTLASIEFHCDASGDSTLGLDVMLSDAAGYYFRPDKVVGGVVHQTSMYYKDSYIDYAPSGVPDFDQRQDSWGKTDSSSGLWKWTWCGPTAVANSLWWMDSRFEPGRTPPPTISDGFPLLTAYGMWDDHDPQNVQPFVTDLGWYMDVDGNRTGYPWNGTDVHQMEKGIAMYLRNRGLETEFVIKKMKKPDFLYVEREIERCEDVILLLGIWQSYDGIIWWRVGGHFVTCAGVDSPNTKIAFSDPDANNAEAGGLGRVLPPGVPHPHPPRPIVPPQEDTVHNNASFVSHDTYSVTLTSPSPGGNFAVEFYEPITNTEFIQNIQGQNCPSEFKSQERPYDPTAKYIAAEVEYSIIISPADWYFKPPQEDYAPSGVPDFDQKQWLTDINWTNPYPPIGTWSHCGPVAVANSLWWLDSQFEPNPIPPPEINDGFPLVESYGPGVIDDHDPQNVPYLVEHLAWYMDTNGMRTKIPHCGTEVHDMEYGIDWYLREKGLYWKFYEHTQKAPDFFWIEDQVKKCEDVILLLGFWQESPTRPGYWWRVGGHFVTCAGVDSTNMMLALSDPYIDNAEWGFPGRVIPRLHKHTGPPETLHNNATYVSHDFYLVGRSPSPGGPFGIYQYPAEDIIDNFGSCQNTPEEFIELDGDYVPGLPMYTEIEYAVIISCKTGIVAAGCEDTNVYVWDFYGNLQWQFATGPPVLSVALDNEGKYLASGSRHLPDGPGVLLFFDALRVTNGSINPPLWAWQLPISESYDGGWAGTESKSVDVKYNYYNQCDVVAAATDYGLYLFDQSGNLIWYYTDEWPETIVRISQDGNYIVCADYHSMMLHYFSHLTDGVPGWGPRDGVPVWSFGAGMDEFAVYWTAISGIGDYVAVSGWTEAYPPSQPENTAAVLLLNRTGGVVWGYRLPKGGFVRVDMPCHGRSVVSVNDNPNDRHLGCDLLYFSDGGDDWDSGDGTPVWAWWRDYPSPQNPLDDFYTVAISENGDYIATGGAPPYAFLLDKTGVLLQSMVATAGNATQSVDLTFTGEYGAYGDFYGVVWFFDKDIGVLWSRNTDWNAPIHSIAVSKIYPCMFPYPDHDIAVVNVTTSKDGCIPMPTVSKGQPVAINVTVLNKGDFSENFTVTVYANSSLIGSQNVFSLAAGDQVILPFVWNTTGLAYGNYTITAFASIVPYEINVYDNSYDTDGYILVTIPGDVNGDFKCEGKDIAQISRAFNTWPGKPLWNPNADINGDNKVEGKDIAIASKYFGTHYP